MYIFSYSNFAVVKREGKRLFNLMTVYMNEKEKSKWCNIIVHFGTSLKFSCVTT